MAEAEDVLLEAAERATATVRSLWTRQAPAGEPERSASAARRRIDAWLTACFGRTWPVEPADTPPRPGWLRRVLGHPPPWTLHPIASPSTDGHRLLLPRALLEQRPGDGRNRPDESRDGSWRAGRRSGRRSRRSSHTRSDQRADRRAGSQDDVLLVAALSLGARLKSGRLALMPAAPQAARDVFWVVEAALADAQIARELPGLAARITDLRREELSRRPDLEPLRPAEREVERLVRELLGAPPDADLRLPERGLLPAPDAASVARFAVAFAHDVEGRPARDERFNRSDRVDRCDSDERDFRGLLGRSRDRAYRGVAPARHWGVPTVREAADFQGTAQVGAESQASGSRRARLPRRVAGRPEDVDLEEARRSIFMMGGSDAHLSVADPAGLSRPPDHGDEDPEALAEELANLEEAPRVRTDTPVREVLEGGAALRPARPVQAVAAQPEAWLYPEWDFTRSAYRQAGCVLRERPAPRGDPLWAAEVRRRRAALLARLRRVFQALRPRHELVPRQLDGEQLDLDGWVEEFADRRAGRGQAGRLYAREVRRRRDVSVALLVDASGSTDGWVAGRMRVIDVAREAALCFCEALSALGDRYAVYAFSGQGPGDVRVWVAKPFEEPAGEATYARIAGLGPDSFTRLGGPLRHATLRLSREPARTRVLLLLSDGKPNDEDLYEGEYGVEDVRQAVVEARAQGVKVFCVTIDREGPAYLPRMFGPRGYTVLRNVTQLPERLPDLYRHLTAGV